MQQWLGSQGLPTSYPTQAALVAAYDAAREAEKQKAEAEAEAKAKAEAEAKEKEQEALNDAYQKFRQADQQSMQEYEAYKGEQEKHRQKDVDQSSKPASIKKSSLANSSASSALINPITVVIVVGIVLIATATIIGHNILNTPAINEQRASPPKSNDITQWFVDQLNNNIEDPETIEMQEKWQSLNPLDKIASLKTWVGMVRTGAVWDYKNDIIQSDIIPSGKSTVQLGNIDVNYQTVANINYG
ncbi:MAG: hypothetical protein GYA58_02180 [Anaerolineaceae bacterium]|nr:hypothetical protein [Anaerolineaceae bacterium]